MGTLPCFPMTAFWGTLGRDDVSHPQARRTKPCCHTCKRAQHMTRTKDNLRHLAWGSLFAIGFTLSPISWWNDAVVNLPIAYLAAQLAAMLDQRLFLFAFVGTYWATNLIGLLGMHVSARKLLRQTEQRISLRRFFLISLLYTLLIVALAQFKWIQSPFVTAQ